MVISYIIIAETILLTPLIIWYVVRQVRKEDAQLALKASLITFFIQSIICFMVIEQFLMEPFLFVMAFTIGQLLVVFQMYIVRMLHSDFSFLRSQPLIITVGINSLAHTIPLWLLAVFMLKRMST